MANAFSPELQRLVEEHMASGHYPSEEALLVTALHVLAEREADLVAVKEAIADMDAGDRGRPLEEVADEIRRKYGWSAD